MATRSRRVVNTPNNQNKPFVSGGFIHDNANRQGNAGVEQKAPQEYDPTTVTPQKQRLAFQNHSIDKTAVPPPPVLSNFKIEDKKIKLNEPQTPMDNDLPLNQGTVDSDGNNDEIGEDGKKKSFFRRLGANRKKPSVRAKEKRIRQNRRLRKVLIPKNALMALHEVKGIRISDFVIRDRVGGGFTAEVSVNNIQYEGNGSSKNNAKNNACEKALRDLIISKMLQKPASLNKEPTTAGGDQEMEENGDDVEMKNEEGNEDGAEEEDVPMVNLASFALFKLFSEWEKEGFEIPEFRAPNANLSASTNSLNQPEKAKKPPTIRNELPANYELMHPATLLCMMRPGISYTDLGVEGEPPNQVQRMGVSVDGESFIGAARSKKAARREAAVAACNKLFETTYTPA